MGRNPLLTSAIAVAAIAAVAGQSTPANEALREAARAGDTARITAALAQGADVNATACYDVTALISDGLIIVRTLDHLYGIGN